MVDIEKHQKINEQKNGPFGNKKKKKRREKNNTKEKMLPFSHFPRPEYFKVTSSSHFILEQKYFQPFIWLKI